MRATFFIAMLACEPVQRPVEVPWPEPPVGAQSVGIAMESKASWEVWAFDLPLDATLLGQIAPRFEDTHYVASFWPQPLAAQGLAAGRWSETVSTWDFVRFDGPQLQEASAANHAASAWTSVATVPEALLRIKWRPGATVCPEVRVRAHQCFDATFADHEIHALTTQGSDALVFTHQGYGFRIKSEPWRLEALNLRFEPQEEVRSIAARPDGTYWFGSRSGLHWGSPDSDRSEIRSSTVASVDGFQQAQAIYWMATVGERVFTSGYTWSLGTCSGECAQWSVLGHFSRGEGNGSDRVGGIVVTPQGILMLGSLGTQLVRFSPNLLNFDEGLVPHSIELFGAATNGGVYSGSPREWCYGGYDNLRERCVPTPEIDFLRAMAEFDQGVLLLGRGLQGAFVPRKGPACEVRLPDLPTCGHELRGLVPRRAIRWQNWALVSADNDAFQDGGSPILYLLELQ